MVESSCLERGRWDRGRMDGVGSWESIAVACMAFRPGAGNSSRGLVLGIGVTSCPLPRGELFAFWH